MAPIFEKHSRRSIRLKGYDYSLAGAYFVTLCTQGRLCLFGDAAGGKLRLNEYGEIVRHEWFRTASMRPNVRLYETEFVVMPNHVHGIIWIADDAGATNAGIVGATAVGATCRSPQHGSTLKNGASVQNPPPCGPAPQSLGAIIAGFKSAAAKRINALRRTPGAPVWQRNYYEHIIRDEESLKRIQQYIINNPSRWAMDRHNTLAADAGPEDAWHA